MSEDYGNEQVYASVSAMSPSKIQKRDDLRICYECIQHKSRAYKNPNEKWAFASKVEDLMFRLLPYTKSTIKKKLEKHYNEMNEEIDKIKASSLDIDKKDKEITDIRFEYALSIHEHNLKLLPETAILEVDAEGDLDVTNEEILEVIRGGYRQDDTKIQFGR